MMISYIANVQPPAVDNKGPPVKRAKEDTKEPEKKKIRKRSVKASAAVKMSHSSGSNNVICLVFKLSMIIHAGIALEDTFMQDLWDISLR